MKKGNRSALRERYAVLLDIGRTLAATLRPEELYHALWVQASRVIEHEGFFVSRYDARGDTAAVVFYANRGRVEQLRLSYPASESPALQERRPLLRGVEEEGQKLGVFAPPELRRPGMVVPILRGDQLLGVMGAQSSEPGAYDEEDLALFAAIADLAAVALENALYVEQLERRHREAERIEEIGRAITGSLELPKVLGRVAGAASDLLDADSAVVWLLKEDGKVEVAMTAGDTFFPQGLEFAVDPEIFAAARQRGPGSCASLTEFELAPPQYRKVALTGSSIAVLLTAEDSCMGALSVRHRKRRVYADDDISLLGRIADQTTIAVANARLHERIISLSLTDALTGLPNRRRLEIFLEKEFAAARRGRKLSIVIYDLDHFKSYNDTAGHQAGDEALRAFARILADNSRAMNLAARYGGDEFVTVLTDVDRRGTVIHVDRIVDAVDQHPLLGPAGITVSAGIAIFGTHVESAEALINAADRNLYLRKAAQRTRTPEP